MSYINLTGETIEIDGQTIEPVGSFEHYYETSTPSHGNLCRELPAMKTHSVWRLRGKVCHNDFYHYQRNGITVRQAENVFIVPHYIKRRPGGNVTDPLELQSKGVKVSVL